jgi:DNA-binding HxlR family transcriptional regulator
MGEDSCMSAKGQVKEGVDEMILSALTSEPQRTAIIQRKCGCEGKTTIENHLHRLSVKGKIVREKVQSSGPHRYVFKWRLRDADQSTA